MQFLPVANDLDAEALEMALEIPLQFQNAPEVIKISLLTPEHVVAPALKVGRPKDRDRIIHFLSENAVNREALREVLTRHNRLEKWWSAFLREVGLSDF